MENENDPFVEELPKQNGYFNYSYVSLPKGNLPNQLSTESCLPKGKPSIKIVIFYSY